MKTTYTDGTVQECYPYWDGERWLWQCITYKAVEW